MNRTVRYVAMRIVVGVAIVLVLGALRHFVGHR